MSVSKYRKIPVEVRAIQYATDTLGECVQFLEDFLTVSLGDFIVCGVEGECYPCKPNIFLKTYEKA